MSPPIHKDWWLAAALTGAAVPAALGQTAPAAGADRNAAGQVTSVAPAGGLSSAPLYIDNARQQRIVNNTAAPMHVLFSDQSAITVAPNSEVVVRDYRFDTQTRAGNIVLELTRGLLRVVGGQISKRTATQVSTPTATIGVRGGISLVQADAQNTQAVFLFGEQMTVGGNAPGGAGTLVDRPGWGASVGPNTPPATGKVDPGTLNQLLGSFGTPAGAGLPPVAGAGTPAGASTLVRQQDSFAGSRLGTPGPTNTPELSFAQLPPPPLPTAPAAVYIEPPSRAGSPT
jgi:hypothetical protein